MTDDSDFFKDLLTRIDEAAVEITPEEIECRDKKDFFDSLCEDPADFKRRKEAEESSCQ